jgi:Uma2 family endonuclease
MGGGAYMPATQTGKLTYADYAHIPDDGLRHEIIDGEHYVSPSPSERHQRASGALFSLLWQHVRRQRLASLCSNPPRLRDATSLRPSS